MLSRRASRGDTIIEVLLAFGVFAALAVIITATMNRSIATAQRSLEVTTVRQQIDAQADLLRYARDNNLPAWQQIKSNMYSGSAPSMISSLADCPSSVSNNSFFLGLNKTNGQVTRVSTDAPGAFAKAQAASRFDFSNATNPRSEGIWVMAVHADGSSSSSPTPAYDMHIRACWDTVGQSMPLVLSAIVRLYDT